MAFLDELREHLKTLDAEGDTPASTRGALDLPAARRHLLEAMERQESAAEEPGAAYFLPRIVRDVFLRSIESKLREGVCAGADAATLQRHVHQAIDLAIGLPVEGLSRSRRRELRAIGDEARQHALSGTIGEDRSLDARSYALENRLVRVDRGRLVVSSLGRLLIALPEPDAVRWLLLIETLQSMGQRDDPRMPLEALDAVLRHPSRTFPEYEEQEEAPWPWSSNAMGRLVALGVVDRWEHPDDPEWGYQLVPAWRTTLEEIVTNRPTPWRVLAETLIAEERNAVPSARTSVTTVDDATEVLQRHSKMVAHEIHNAMTPVQHALRKLYDALARHAPDDGWKQYQERVDRNIDRTVRFATQMADAVSLAVAPHELFDPAAAVRDAITELNGGVAGRVTFEPDATVPRLPGHRHRFVMVVVNLLRNAMQSTTERPVLIRVDLSISNGHVKLAVSDDGPGVPEQYREAIFQPSFTLRDGGQGQGLALVRDVVTREMGGSIRYETSDMGGASFVLLLPTSARSAT